MSSAINDILKRARKRKKTTGTSLNDYPQINRSPYSRDAIEGREYEHEYNDEWDRGDMLDTKAHSGVARRAVREEIAHNGLLGQNPYQRNEYYRRPLQFTGFAQMIDRENKMWPIKYEGESPFSYKKKKK